MKIELSEQQIKNLENGDYTEVEAVVEDIVFQSKHPKYPCEHLTHGGKCDLKFYLLQEPYEEVVKSCPIKKTVLLAGDECWDTTKVVK
jgi:hypothetical protein